jgi:long-chain fatty acid transport protein
MNGINERFANRVSLIHERGLAVLAGVTLALSPSLGLALGVRVPNQDPEAIARGNAFAATANNPSALYYNPAGITQLSGHNVQIGALNYLGLTSQFRSPTGDRAETEYEIVPIPQIYYTYSPSSLPLSFGLGLYAPFGLGLEWPETTGFRTLAIEGRLHYLTFNPVIAWKVSQTLSLAIGPTFNYSDLKLRSGILSPAPGGDELLFKGDDFAYGFNAGLRWQPHAKWSFGVNYRSATTVNYRGSTTISSPLLPSGTVDSSAKVDFPQIVSAGVSFRPTPHWNIEADIDWTDWDTLNTLIFDQSTIGPIPFPLNWRASWFYQIGASYYFDSGCFIGAGYFFSSNSTTEYDFNPIVPDTDLHVGSIGGGYKGKHWRWGLAAQIITGPWRTINSTAPHLSGQSPNGQYRWIVPAVTFSIGYHF